MDVSWSDGTEETYVLVVEDGQWLVEEERGSGSGRDANHGRGMLSR